MKIAIDLRMYGPSFGLGRYNQRLLENLVKIGDDNQYILIFNDIPQNLPMLPDNFHIKSVSCKWYSISEQIILPMILYKLKADLVHFPHFNVPIFYKGKFIVTIHDLIMTRFPSRKASTLSALFFDIKYWFYDVVINHAIRKSHKIIAVSQFTANDIIDYFKLSKEATSKITVIHEGVSTRQVTKVEDIEVPDKFFLYVGNAYPHKNLEFLINTFKHWIEKNPDYYLILVGKTDYFYERLYDFCQDKMAAQRDRVIFTDFVVDEKLVSYYQKASAYVFPSKYEGFGLPALEAMHQALPVLSSSAASLPEVLGSAALYFDPQNQADLLNKMEQITSDVQLKSQLIALGKKQIDKYSWERMTMEIISLYRS